MSEEEPQADVPQNEETPQAEEAPAEKPKPKMSLMAKLSKGRKKKIAALLLSKAKTDLQVEAEEAERAKQAYISENVRTVEISGTSTSQLRDLCEEFQELLRKAEGDKFDMEIHTKRRDLQIANMRVKAHDARGKFAMPTLKKVKKNDNKSKKKSESADLRSTLKKTEATEE